MPNIADEIRDIFEIPSEGDKESDYEVDNDDSVTSVDFEDRVSDVKKKLKEIKDTDITSMPKKNKEKEKTDNDIDNEDLLKSSIDKSKSDTKVAETSGSDDIFSEFEDKDDLGVDEKKNDKNDSTNEPQNADNNIETEVQEAGEKASNKVEAEVPKESSNNDDEPVKKQVINHVKVINDKIEWILPDSPPDRYRDFYSEKKNIIPQLLQGEQIPYADWLKELRTATIDIGVLEIYDFNAILEKIRAVQLLRDRIQEITIQCNAQYYIWERIIELFHGLLAKVEVNVRPAVAREASVYEHMRDMELYFYRVKTIHRSAEQILKNLELTYEALSRQVTISMQNRDDTGRVMQKSKEIQLEETVTASSASDNFDSLPESAESKQPSKKTQLMNDWLEIN